MVSETSIKKKKNNKNKKKNPVKHTKIQVKDIFVGANFGPDFPQVDIHLHTAILISQVRFRELTGLLVCVIMNNNLNLTLFSYHMLCAFKHLLWF